MDFSKFFDKTNLQNSAGPKTEWGGTGAMPQIGKEPAQPALPNAQISADTPRIAEPSADALNVSKSILQSKSGKSG